MKFSITPIIIILALLLLLSLSAWQLQRGLYKQAILDAMSTRTQLQTLGEKEIVAITQHPSAFNYREITLQGQFLNHQTLLLDNKINNGQVGYHVITPFQIQNHILLVNRGWIAMGKSRAVLPIIEPVLNYPITIKGKLEIHHKNRFINNTLESTLTEPSFPIRLQEIDFSLIQKLLHHANPAKQHAHQYGDLIPMIINLSPESLFSFEPIPEKAIWLNPEKHFAYAVQWLLLALALGIIYTIARR